MGLGTTGMNWVHEVLRLMYQGAASVLDEQQKTVPQQWQPQAKGVGDAYVGVAVVPLPLDPVGTPRLCGADASGVEGHSRMT